MMHVTYALPWESYNVIMLVLSILLLIWLLTAQDRFFRALKFRAAYNAESVVFVRGLQNFAYLLENATADHSHAIQHWRTPTAALNLNCTYVPFNINHCRQYNNNKIVLQYQSTVPCMITILRNVNITKFKIFLNNNKSHCIRPEKMSVPDSNKAVLDFFQLSKAVGACGASLYLPAVPKTENIHVPFDNMSVCKSCRSHEQETIAGQCIVGSCILIIPMKTDITKSKNKSNGEMSANANTASYRVTNSDDVTQIVDYGLYVTHMGHIPLSASLNPNGIFNTNSQVIATNTLSPYEIENGQQSGSNNNATTLPTNTSANTNVDNIDVNSLLVGINTQIFDMQEVFGQLESHSAKQTVTTDQNTNSINGTSHRGAEVVNTNENEQKSNNTANSNIDHSTSSHNDECVVCLTESKEVLLLPCRHLCVCRSCFQHVDKCPVCRATYDRYVTVQRDSTTKKRINIPALSSY